MLTAARLPNPKHKILASLVRCGGLKKWQHSYYSLIGLLKLNYNLDIAEYLLFNFLKLGYIRLEEPIVFRLYQTGFGTGLLAKIFPPPPWTIHLLAEPSL